LKCQIIRDDVEVSPAFAEREELQTLIVRVSTWRDSEYQLIPFWRNGAILEHPEVHWLVRQGVAIPADDACRVRAKRTPEQMQAAQHAYERLMAHIEYDDWKLFDEGVIAGYNPDGSFKPGPNYSRLQEFIAAEKQEAQEDDVI
jgi:hypothetical protein